MSHTPGPWKAAHMVLVGGDGLRKKDMWGVSSDYMVKAKNDQGEEYEYGYAICDVNDADWRLLPEADAKLIAAAPELLASLQHCAEALKAIGGHRGLVADHGDALDGALLAIDKATK